MIKSKEFEKELREYVEKYGNDQWALERLERALKDAAALANNMQWKIKQQNWGK